MQYSVPTAKRCCSYVSETKPNLRIKKVAGTEIKVFTSELVEVDGHQLYVVDWWGNEVGQTTVYWQTESGWISVLAIQYEGKYKEAAIPELMRILRAAWEANNFYACGRGPPSVTAGPYRYECPPRMMGSVYMARYTEKIYDGSGMVIGSHTFKLMWLIPENPLAKET